jgi:hypothetical protein
MALYTECLHAASAALGPGVEMETVRAKAKDLFESAIADIAAAGGESPPQN